MKKVLFCLLALISSMSLFTACSSDNDEIKYPVEKEIAGTYKGKMDVYIVGIPEPVADDLVQKVYITKASDSAIKLELRNFSIRVGEDDLVIGDISVDKCELSQKGDIYLFTGKQTLNLVVGKCETSVSGTIGKGSVNMDIKVDVAELSMKVEVNYEGERLTGSESSEAKILSFTFENEFVTEQPEINESAGTITFKVSDAATDKDLASLAPVIEVSEKATVSPASGVTQDFSAGKQVVYTVKAEDGTTQEYTVSVSGKMNVLKFSFEEWKHVGASLMANAYDKPMPTELLATSAEGAAMLKLMGITDVPVYKTEDMKKGKFAIKLVTIDTSKKASSLVPAITSGSLFTGRFDTSAAMADKLSGTKFGISYDKKPLSFRGWYKYTPGSKYIDGSDWKNIKEVDEVDECAVQAVLYKVDKAEETLTGHDINTSDKRVAIALLKDGTAKSEYTFFDIPFVYLEGKSYEEGATYKLAIVCSSSKSGDSFKGAGGSTLILDELEIIGE